MKERVLNYLKLNPAGRTPTEIGMALGKSYSIASSSVSGALKSLVNEEKITRTKIDGKILYSFLK